jgi:hypothetical protein
MIDKNNHEGELLNEIKELYFANATLHMDEKFQE